jgi:hypothetical protein
MPDKALHTDFAPAERETEEVIREQAKLIARHSPRMMIDGLPLPVVVVNSKRQIVFCNKKFEVFSREQEDVLPLGRRPGEALGCAYAALNEGGCGTTRFCRFCGAARAILQSLDGAHSVELCRLVRKRGEHTCLDFQVFAEPLLCEGVPFVLFSVLDISKELRLESIRHKFLADVRRRAEAINRMYVSVSRDQGSESVKGGLFALGYASRMLMEQIDDQSRLFDAEDGLLGVAEERLDACEALGQALAGLENVREGDVVLESCTGLSVFADRHLLDYVLRQLFENGLEAAQGKGPIHAGCVDHGHEVGLRVGSPDPLPERVRLQLFQRGFTTKGEGRGLGLYYARLLARRYLNGDVLHLEAEPGAVFEVRLRKG